MTPDDTAKEYFEKGRAFHNEGRYEDALILYEKAISLDSEKWFYWGAKGHTLSYLKYYEVALIAYEKSIKLYENAFSWRGKGETFFHLKRYEESLIAYEKAISLDSEDSLQWIEKGDILIELKRYKESIFLYEKAISITPEEALNWHGKGLSLTCLKRYEEALVAYEKAISLDDEYAISWGGKGNVLFRLKRYEEALASFEKAISIDPNDGRVLYNRASLLFYGLASPLEALADIDACLCIMPHFSQAWILLAHIALVQGMTIRADRALHRFFLTATPQDIVDNEEIIRIVGESWQHSILPLRALRAVPTLHNDTDWQALLHGASGEIAQWAELCQAVELFLIQAAQIKPKADGATTVPAAAQRALGLIHLLYGDHIAAQEAFAAWAELEPESPEAQYFSLSCRVFLQGGVPGLQFDAELHNAVQESVAKARNFAQSNREADAGTCLHLSLMLSGFGEDADLPLARSLLERHRDDTMCLAQLAALKEENDEEWESSIQACLELEEVFPEKIFLGLAVAPSIPTFLPGVPHWTDLLLRFAYLKRFAWLEEWWDDQEEAGAGNESDLYICWRERLAVMQRAAKARQKTESVRDGISPEDMCWILPRRITLSQTAAEEMRTARNFVRKEKDEKSIRQLRGKLPVGMLKEIENLKNKELLNFLDKQVLSIGPTQGDSKTLRCIVALCWLQQKIHLEDAAAYTIFIHVKSGGSRAILMRFLSRGVIDLSVSALAGTVIGILGAGPLATIALPLAAWGGAQYLQELLNPQISTLVYDAAETADNMEEFRASCRQLIHTQRSPGELT